MKQKTHNTLQNRTEQKQNKKPNKNNPPPKKNKTKHNKNKQNKAKPLSMHQAGPNLLATCSTNLLHSLRILTECFILVGAVMFGATFNLVTSIELP